jgi:hypothetical protein
MVSAVQPGRRREPQPDARRLALTAMASTPASSGAMEIVNPTNRSSARPGRIAPPSLVTTRRPSSHFPGVLPATVQNSTW